jgi:transketolase C-terminal domain/subunit
VRGFFYLIQTAPEARSAQGRFGGKKRIGAVAARGKLDALIVTYGRIAEEALAAAEQLKSEGITCGILLCEQLLPISIPADALMKVVSNTNTPILVLEEGKMLGFGTHAELMETCGIYREIAETQMGEVQA